MALLQNNSENKNFQRAVIEDNKKFKEEMAKDFAEQKKVRTKNKSAAKAPGKQ